MSISQVAQAAKVSYATAWRIINNRPCRSEEAIAAVRAAMSRMGYSPNSINGNGNGNGGMPTPRRGRRPKAADGIRTHNIALLNLRETTSIGSTILAYVQRMLGERNLNLIFAHAERADLMPQAVRSGNVDGILGYGEFPADAITTSLQRVPAVWMMSRASASSFDTWGDRVRPDHQEIGRIAAGRLLELGHRHIAYFNPDPHQSMNFERGIAFRAVIEYAISQGRADSVSVINADHLLNGVDAASIAAGHAINSFAVLDAAAEQFVNRWIALSPRPTGVFVPVDRVTLRVYRHLARRGIEVGKDIQIISCDNEAELLSLMEPTPESIDLNRRAVARLAVERLLWRMKNGPAAPAVVITVSPALGTRETAPNHVGSNGNGIGSLKTKLAGGSDSGNGRRGSHAMSGGVADSPASSSSMIVSASSIRP
jgi:DNA-binding LacI/PurR family transcriptional regulator